LVLFQRADVVVLIAVCIIYYFILGQNNEAYFMLAASCRFWVSFLPDNRSLGFGAFKKLNRH
jgi:Ca2+-transporting ATPase